MLAALIIGWHWLGCLWWLITMNSLQPYVPRLQPYAPRLQPHVSRWFIAMNSVAGGSDWGPPDIVRCAADVCPEGFEPSEFDLTPKYLFALYWAVAMTTGIGGNGKPLNGGEMLYTTIVIIVGIFMIAVVIGNFASILANIDAANALKRERVASVTSYLRSRKIPTPLQRRILDYFEYVWSWGEGHSEVVNQLPLTLRLQLSMVMNKRLFEKMPLFKDISELAILYILQKMKPGFHLPGQLIITEGKVGHALYFITRGKADIIRNGKVISQLSDNDFFGERSLATDERTNASIRACVFTELMMLTRKDFDSVAALFPDVRQKVVESAAELHEKRQVRFRQSSCFAKQSREQLLIDNSERNIPSSTDSQALGTQRMSKREGMLPKEISASRSRSGNTSSVAARGRILWLALMR